MGDGHRSARRDLFLKQRDHAAVAPQHVSEAHCYKFRLIMLVEGLNDHLADPFAGSHDVGGIHRLVRGDHHEFSAAVHRCCGSRLPGPEHVVFNGFVGACLHQRHMLVGGRMVYDIRTIFRKNGVHSLRIAHGSDQHHERQIGMSLQKLLLNIIGIIFINIHDNQPGRLMRGDLPTQLASDGTAAARDHHHLVLHIAQNGVQIHADRLSSQKVFHLHVPQLADAHFTVDQLVHAGQGTQLAVRLLTDIQDVTDHRSGRGRNRDKNFINIIQVGGLDDFVPAAHHLDALNELAPFLFIVVDDAADDHGAVIAADDLLNQRVSRLSGSDDHDGNIVLLILHPVLAAPQKPVGKTADEHEGDQQEQIHEIVTVRHRLAGNFEQVQADSRHDGGQEAGNHQILHLVFSREGPQAVIQAEEVKDGQRQQDVERQEVPDRKDEFIRNGIHMHIIAQKQRQKACRGDAQNIIYDQRRSPVQKLIIEIMFLRLIHFTHCVYVSFLERSEAGQAPPWWQSPSDCRDGTATPPVPPRQRR